MAHLVLDVDGTDHVFQLRGLTCIGRHANNDIQVLDAQVSKRHCEIEERDGTWFLRDLGGLNGTYLNDVRVKGEARLAHRDIVRVGSSLLWFSDLKGALAEHPPPDVPAVGDSAASRADRAVSGVDRTALDLGEPRRTRAEREHLFRKEIDKLLRISTLADLLPVLLAGASQVTEADAGALLGAKNYEKISSADGLELLEWSGRGREILGRDYFQELGERALRTGMAVSQSVPRDEAYRVWQPRCTMIAPLAHADRTFALLAVELDGDEPLELPDFERYARIAAAAWGALRA